jgi:hypothetical protein
MPVAVTLSAVDKNTVREVAVQPVTAHPNIQHPTSNNQHRTSKGGASANCHWMFPKALH